MVRTFIQIIALALTLISSFFLIRSSMTLSSKDIASLASTKWDYNKELVDSLSAQKANSITGFSLLLIAFLFQWVNIVWPMRWDDFAVNKKGIILALCISVLVFAVSFYVTKVVKTNIQKAIDML